MKIAGNMVSGGTSSTRSPFRSQLGCCICGTKSSSSRFTVSSRYSEHFAGCFGASSSNRCGDLCNACVLCVKRWLQRDRPPNLFAQVVDSKKGPGPKHMKEITKRARRREEREKNKPPASGATSTTTSHKVAASTQPISLSANTRLSTSNGSAASTVSTKCAISGPDFSNPHCHHRCQWPSGSQLGRNGRHHLVSDFCSPYPVGATFTRAAAAAIRNSEAAGLAGNNLSEAGSACYNGCPWNFVPRCCHTACHCPTHVALRNSTGSRESGLGSSRSSTDHPLSLASEDSTCSKRPRYDDVGPVNACHGCHCPSTASFSCVTRSQAICCCSAKSEFRHPASVTPSVTSTSSTPESNGVATTRRYNRRVTLPPVRMADNAEVDSLLREIMERNSQALTFDSREMHMAVQKELRLRSRTVQQHVSSAASSSMSGRASSVSSTDGSIDTSRIDSTPSSSVSTTVAPLLCHCSVKRHCVQHCCSLHHSHCLHEHLHLRHMNCVHPSCNGGVPSREAGTRKS